MNLEKEPEIIIVSNEFSKVIPIKKFVLYSILSMNLYTIYWIYKSWKNIKEENNIKLTPVLRTIFFMYFSGSLARQTLEMAKSEGYKKSYSPLIVFISVFILFIFRKLPEPYDFLNILLFLPLIPIVQASNFYWEKKHPNLKIKEKFSAGSIVLMIIGGIFLCMSILGSFIPDDIDTKSKIEIKDESN